MQSRTTTKTTTRVASEAAADRLHVAVPSAPRPVRRRLRERVRARLGGDSEEDGVFRPVRLPLWIDLGIAAMIVLVAAGGFVGFFLWLAHTQAR